jgi:predicted RND superfamily exporter protein
MLSILSLFGSLSLRIETSTDSVLDRRTEPWTFYETSQESFGGDELVVVAVSNEQPFSSFLLHEIVRLTGELEDIEGVRRVDSLATVPLIRADPNGSLDLTAALEPGVPTTESSRLVLFDKLKQDRIAPRSLISDDGRVAALNVFLEANLSRSFDDVIADISHRVEAPHVRLSGVPIFRTQINLRTASEVSAFAVITLILISVCFRLLFGSVRATLVPVAIGGLGGWLILGSMGALGFPLSLSTMILPSILLALGCAYSTHLVFAMGRETISSERHGAAEDVALPVALSGLTTAIGFVAIAVVPIEALRQVGILGALGALITTGLVLTLAPVILDRWPPQVSAGLGERWIGGVMRRSILKITSRPKFVILVSLVLGVAGGTALPNLSLETDATKWFRKGTEVRDAYDSIRRDLSGISPINIVITADDGRLVTEPKVIKALEELSTYLGTLDDVGKVLSIADPLLSVHRVFSPETDTIESIELSEQYMLMLSSEEQIFDLIEHDHRQANVLVRVDDNGSDHLLAIAKDAEDWWRTNGARGYKARATGIMFEFARAENRIADGQILGVQLAILCIGLLLLLIFRSRKLAAAALVANVVPMLIAFGGMAWLGIPLDAGSVLVANLALGIAVDDTIHFASVYQNEPTLDSTLRKVLPSLASTTLAVGAGFLILGFSEFAFTRNLGLLTATIMLLCFLADVVLLPCLLGLGSRHTLSRQE